MPLPVTIPNTFANATTSIPLSQLDSNFSTLANAINGINSGSETVANLRSSNVTITGGIISNVTLDNVTVDVETLSNVTINGGNVTVTNMVATTANANTINVTTINARDGTASMSLANTTGILSLSNALVTTAGTSAAPAIYPTGDPNTGIFFPAADTIAFAEGGAEAMRITSAGNLDIGGSAYARRLSVKDATNTVVVIEGSNAGSSNINFADSDSENPGSINYGHATNYMAFQTAGSERMRIDSSGNVGIGTSSVATKLNVKGSAATLIESESTGAESYLGLKNSGGYAYVGSSANNLLFLTSVSGTERMRIDSSGNVDLIQSANLTWRFAPASTIRGSISVDSADVMYFRNGSSNTERMRIDSSGNIRAEKAVRATITADNDGSFDMNAASNFTCTPTGAITLTFTNITSGQSGNILLVNNSNYAITAAATTKVATGALTTLSATGTYWLSYFSNGTNVYIANTGALA